MHNDGDNNTIKVVLENGSVKTNLEFSGIKGTKTILKQVFKTFLNTIADSDEQQEKPKIDLMDEMKKAYEEVAKTANIDNDIDVVEDVKQDEQITITFEENQLDKYDKEFPKLRDAVSRNLYNKLTDLQIHQDSYFVTNNGVLKLKGRYSCQCGNFKKAWIPYPNGKKYIRCTECAKTNILVNVKGEFPSIDEFGNFYVTSNLVKNGV